MRPATVLLALLLPPSLLLVARGQAFGAGEKEWQVAARLGAATINVDGRKPWGIAGALDVEYGLSDAWALRGSVGTSFHSVSASGAGDTRPSGAVRTNAALAGLTYTIDVLRLIPYANLQVGAVQFAGAVATPQTMFAAALGVGADYFNSRQWTSGLSLQYLFRPADLFSDPLNLGSSPFSFSITFRLSRIF